MKHLGDYSVGINYKTTGLNEATQALQNFLNVAKTNPDLKITGTNGAVTDLKKASAAAEELQQILARSYNSDLQKFDLSRMQRECAKSKIDVEELKAAMRQTGSAGKQAALDLERGLKKIQPTIEKTKGTIEKLADTFANTIRWSVASTALNSITGSIQKAWYFTKDLDTALNDIRIVTGKSAEEMDKFAVKANEAAKALGASTKNYAQAALIYYQQGLSDTEVQARSDTTVKVANVTGTSAQQASEQLTAIWNGYKVSAQEAEGYIDKVSAVAATTAADLEELSEGMGKVASAANAMGVDIDQLNASLATVISVTRQDAATIGTAFKTIYARMGDLRVDGVDEFGTKLGDVTGQMRQMGIEVLDQNGNLRDMGDVMEEVAAKWGTWTDAQQQAAAVALAGKRQYNNLIALFENWDMYESAKATSQGSSGELQRQQDIFMDSYEAKIAQLKAQTEELYMVLMDNEGTKNLIEGFTAILEVVTQIVGAIGGLNTILPIVAGTLLRVKSTKAGDFIGSRITKKIQSREDKAYLEQKAREDRAVMGAEGSDKESIKNAKENLRNVNADLATQQRQRASKELGIARQQRKIDKMDDGAEKTEAVAKLAQEKAELEQLNKQIVENEEKKKEALKVINNDPALFSIYSPEALARLREDQEKIDEAIKEREIVNDKIVENERQKVIALKKLYLEELKAKQEAYKEESKDEAVINKVLEGRGYTTKASGIKEGVTEGTEGTAAYDVAQVRQDFEQTADPIAKNVLSYLKKGDIASATSEKTTLGKYKAENLGLTERQKESLVRALTKAIDDAKKRTSEGKQYTPSQQRRDKDAVNKVLSEADKEIAAAEKASGRLQKRKTRTANDPTDRIKQEEEALEKLQDIQQDFDKEKLASEEKTTKEALQNLKIETEAVEKRYDAEGKALEDQAQAAEILAENQRKAAEEHQQQEVYKAFGKSLMDAAGGAMQLAGGLQALKGLGNIWDDETLSGGEKILQTIMVLLPGIISTVSGFKELTTGIGAFIKTAPQAIAGFFGLTTATNAQAVASNVAEKGTKKLNNAIKSNPYLLIIGGIIMGIVAAVTALVSIFSELSDAEEREAQMSATLGKQTAELREEYEKTEQAYNNLKDTISDYQDARNALDELTEGTLAWKEAIKQANDYAIELIRNYGQYGLKYTMVSGQIIIDEDSLEQAQEKAFRDTQSANTALFRAQAVEDVYNINSDTTKWAELSIPEKRKRASDTVQNYYSSKGQTEGGYELDDAAFIAGYTMGLSPELEKAGTANAKEWKKKAYGLMWDEADNKELADTWAKLTFKKEDGEIETGEYTGSHFAYRIKDSETGEWGEWEQKAYDEAAVSVGNAEAIDEFYEKNLANAKKILGIVNAIEDEDLQKTIKNIVSTGTVQTADEVGSFTKATVNNIGEFVKTNSDTLNENVEKVLRNTANKLETDYTTIAGTSYGEKTVGSLFVPKGSTEGAWESGVEYKYLQEVENIMSALEGKGANTDAVMELFSSMGPDILQNILDNVDLNSETFFSDFSKAARLYGDALDYADENTLKAVVALKDLDKEQKSLTESYANSLSVMEKLGGRFDSISAKEWNDMAELYGETLMNEYFVKMADGTYMLTKAAKGFKDEANAVIANQALVKLSALGDKIAELSGVKKAESREEPDMRDYYYVQREGQPTIWGNYGYELPIEQIFPDTSPTKPKFAEELYNLNYKAWQDNEEAVRKYNNAQKELKILFSGLSKEETEAQIIAVLGTAIDDAMFSTRLNSINKLEDSLVGEGKLFTKEEWEALVNSAQKAGEQNIDKNELEQLNNELGILKSEFDAIANSIETLEAIDGASNSTEKIDLLKTKIDDINKVNLGIVNQTLGLEGDEALTNKADARAKYQELIDDEDYISANAIKTLYLDPIQQNAEAIDEYELNKINSELETLTDHYDDITKSLKDLDRIESNSLETLKKKNSLLKDQAEKAKEINRVNLGIVNQTLGLEGKNALKNKKDAENKYAELIKRDADINANTIKTLFLDPARQNAEAIVDAQLQLNADTYTKKLERANKEREKGYVDFLRDSRLIEDDFDSDFALTMRSAEINEAAARASASLAKIFQDKKASAITAEKYGELVEQGKFSISSLALTELDNEELMLEAEEQLQENILNLKQDILAIEELQQSTLEKMVTAYDDIESRLGDIIALQDSWKEGVTLMYGEDAYKELDEYYKTTALLQGEQLDNARNKMRDLELNIGKGFDGNDAFDISVLEEYAAAGANILELTNSLAQTLQNEFANYVSGSIKTLTDEWTGGQGIQKFQENWDWLTAEDAKYFDEVEQGFELDKIRREFEDLIDSTTDLNKQQMLHNELIETELGYLKDKKKLTEYDLNAARARLDVLKAQMALEDARNNATAMRLTRGADGTYSYEYVADEAKIREAEGALEEAQYAQYSLAKENFQKQGSEILSEVQNYFAWLSENAADLDGDVAKKRWSAITAMVEEAGVTTGDLQELLGTDVSKLGYFDQNMLNFFDAIASGQVNIDDIVGEKDELTTQLNKLFGDEYKSALSSATVANRELIGYSEKDILEANTAFSALEKNRDVIEDLYESYDGLVDTASKLNIKISKKLDSSFDAKAFEEANENLVAALEGLTNKIPSLGTEVTTGENSTVYNYASTFNITGDPDTIKKTLDDYFDQADSNKDA